MMQNCSVKYYFRLFTVFFVLNYSETGNGVTVNPEYEDIYTKTLCMNTNANTVLRAKHKTCFLRPDTGPCRADLIQWYYDVRQKKCYRFFWGGCQGNGNKFETRSDCTAHCSLMSDYIQTKTPNFCSLSFDYGTCFGYFTRWGWDYYSKTCRRRIYSGCGGNQNNFETREECWETCLVGSNNTLPKHGTYTTCIPFDGDDFERK